MDGHLTRRSLLKLAGVAAAAVGADALKGGWFTDEAAAGPAAVASGAVIVRSRSGADRGAVLHREREIRRNITEGGRPAADAPPGRRQRLDVQADQGRDGRRLALRRARQLLRRRAETPEPSCAASSGRTQGNRDLPDGLSRLVPGPHGAHPREGARAWERRAHGPALLPGPGHRRRVSPLALLRPPQSRRAQHRGCDLPKRRQALAPQPEEERSRLRGHDPDGRPPIAEPLRHVLWIGGPPGSGKTTIATRLARRHGLRWYNADTQTWAHRDRALRELNPAAQRWEAMTPAQRWEESSPAEMLELSLHAERGPMVVDDLRRLPSSPLIIAEGSTLSPSVVSSGIADPARAVWLLPTAEFQRAQLDERESHRVPASSISSSRARSKSLPRNTGLRR